MIRSFCDDLSRFAHVPSKSFSYKTCPPTEGKQWAICADSCAISEPHFDAGGYLTVVRMILGYKIWIVALGEVDEMLVSEDGWLKSNQWQMLLLGPGDDL